MCRNSNKIVSHACIISKLRLIEKLIIMKFFFFFFSDAMETDFADTVVVSNWKCPSWAQKKAIQLNIPILSTTWVVQCIIEGKLCPQNHPRYRYTCIPN